MWLSPEILNWQAEIGGALILNESLWKRAHEIWFHAEQVLSSSTTEFQRVDVITTLKRAVDQRVRMLNDLYSFRSIPIRDKPSDTLNLLEFVGVLRPLMLQKLIDIRNTVEHEDAAPPDQEACQVFCELTWYFLRSTDRLTRLVVKDLELRPPDEDPNYWLTLHAGPEYNWVPKLWGWITPNLISDVPKEHWMASLVGKIETREEAFARFKESGAESSLDEEGRGRNPDDMFISAEIRGPSDALTRLVKIYFAVA